MSGQSDVEMTPVNIEQPDVVMTAIDEQPDVVMTPVVVMILDIMISSSPISS